MSPTSLSPICDVRQGYDLDGIDFMLVITQNKIDPGNRS